MDKNIVYSEAELSMASNKITDYIDFLKKTLDEYIEIISDINKDGVQGSVACKELSSIALSLELLLVQKAFVDTKVSHQVKKHMEEVADADKFKFPHDMITGLSGMLNELM